MGFVSRHLNRKVSGKIVDLLVKTSATPNQLTFSMLVFCVPLLLLGYSGHFVLCGILVQVVSILDGVDGEVARRKNLVSERGAVYDTVVDHVLDAVAVMALGLAMLRNTDIPAEVILMAVSLTIFLREGAFVVYRMGKEKRPHLVRDTHDSICLLVMVGSFLAVLNPWLLVLVALAINLLRLDNMIFRLTRGTLGQGILAVL